MVIKTQNPLSTVFLIGFSMPRNHTLSFDLLDSIDRDTSSLIYVFDEENQIENELNYLSKDHFSKLPKDDTKAKILLLSLNQQPFLVYAVKKNALNETNLAESIAGFYNSNKEIPKKIIWVGQDHQSLKEKIALDNQVEFRTVGN